MKNTVLILIASLFSITAFGQLRANRYTTNPDGTPLEIVVGTNTVDLGTNDTRFVVFGDSSRITTFPVAVFRPVLTNISMIVDIMPSGDNMFTNSGSPFFSGIDLVNRNLDAVLDKTNFYGARIAVRTNTIIIGAIAGGIIDAPSVVFPAGTNSIRPFSWVLLGQGSSTLNTNMWMDSAGTLHESNGIAGTVVADNPLAGVTGEFTNRLSTFSSGQTNLITTISTNVLQVTLAAGDWDVQGNVNFGGTTATVTAETAGIGTVANTIPGDGSQCFSWLTLATTSYSDTITIPAQRINVSTSTTVFMCAKATFSSGTIVAYGQIRARRVR